MRRNANDQDLDLIWAMLVKSDDPAIHIVDGSFMLTLFSVRS